MKIMPRGTFSQTSRYLSNDWLVAVNLIKYHLVQYFLILYPFIAFLAFKYNCRNKIRQRSCYTHKSRLRWIHNLPYGRRKWNLEYSQGHTGGQWPTEDLRRDSKPLSTAVCYFLKSRDHKRPHSRGQTPPFLRFPNFRLKVIPSPLCWKLIPPFPKGEN